MKVNWKVRFKNKTWLSMFLSLIIGFVFNLLKMFDIVPVVTENLVMQIVGQVLTFLGLIGVLVDPTTAGLNDSVRAMNYEEPWQDVPNEESV
ncbi:MAG: phage holin [Clostridium sp.]|nr:phage holin [Clostridium sp.]